ncbi:hypothetical protein [Limnohabitans sp.]|uniref:hypothetical protein n=1 Tax=Limnohabitans sp. TaxID=1907725 RepID=UPI0028A251AB|nr:hypothetical protein [Limnohabitans sp.]
MSPLITFTRTFKRVVCTLLANSIVFATLMTPLQNAQALPGEYSPTYRNECSVVDCAFQYPVPIDNWQEVATMWNPQGHRGKVDGREYFKGEQWMALGQHAAGVLGLSSAEVGLKAWMQPAIESHPWVVARFLPERGELRINVIKTIKTPEGMQRVVVTDYTPQHGRWHIVRRMFRDKGENWSPSTRGIDPFYPKHSGAATDPTFYNMSIGAAQVAVGQAMMHHRAPYAFFVETSLRLDQKQTTSGNMLKKKVTTTTIGYARPKVYLAAPLSMSTQRNNVTPSMMAVICPRTTTCTHPDQLAFAGFVMEHLEGGNIPNIEEEIYRNVQTKSSWTGIAFMLVTAALTWGAGAMIAGTGSWGVAGGQIVGLTTSAVEAGAIAGTTIAAGAGLGYATINGMLQGGPLSSPQQNWLGQMGMTPEQVSMGVSDGSYCNNAHCTGLYAAASARHIQSGNPGTPQSGNNFQATRQLIEGNCPVNLSRAQCLAQGLEPGGTPRSDSHPNIAYNSKDFERKRQACISAGYGQDQKTLYNCMATAVYIDESDSAD